ncbi:MAG TPA: homoserine dehydrogenase [Candidatus Egerieicola faecale]|uniref:Homoserine dehydrogenase n=1 Tax=Candidatus Egerieicola faecale TaxID=2840774 RepID=A0A9D1LKY5_9FIRM|nr:homoserine dehydrogenase [Candidatus Egerieicola faecale]
MIYMAVMGHGTVGSGVVEVIHTNKFQVEKNLGEQVCIKRILDLREFDVPYANLFTKDFNDILEDEDITVVAEVMGGIHPAYEFTKSLLKRGKSVCTSNKELVAAKGAELLQIAKQNHVNYFFEASVGGGIPIIRPLHTCLAANRIEEIAGILNGTTNFILTKMIHDKMDFSDALKLAQELGYAERNPSADVDGHDACRKICILADLAYGKNVAPEAVHTEGISSISLRDVAYADAAGYSIKLIGRAKPEGEGLLCMVSPALLPKESPLAGISGVFNGILVRGNAIGDVLFYGQGAGKLATASAVVADMIDMAKSKGYVSSLSWVDDGKNYVVDYKTTSVAFYVRLQGKDLRNQIYRQFEQVTFIEHLREAEDEIAFITPAMVEKDFYSKIAALSSHGVQLKNSIRVLDYGKATK